MAKLHNIRLAVSAATRRVLIGEISKDGKTFMTATEDRTSDFCKAVLDFFPPGGPAQTIYGTDGSRYEVTVKELPPDLTTTISNLGDNLSPPHIAGSPH